MIHHIRLMKFSNAVQLSLVIHYLYLLMVELMIVEGRVLLSSYIYMLNINCISNPLSQELLVLDPHC